MTQTLKEFTLHLREIRVVPVKVMAASLEEAEAMVREGDGEIVEVKEQLHAEKPHFIHEHAQ